MSGILWVVGTPIGNLDDLSPRAARALREAEVIACEDTRVARTLLQRALGGERTRARLIAYHARNERARTSELVRAIAGGARVALTTDAGMPGLSDPGQRLISACVDAGLRVEVIPGPTAIAAALVASGLPTARFVFEGFLPRTKAARRRRLEALVTEERTMVFFEAPHRLEECLDDLSDIFGARSTALARELTKLHEEVVRDTLPNLLARVREQPARGEITLVIAGAEPVHAEPDAEALARDVAERVRSGSSKKDAITAVATHARVSKKVVYQAVLDHVRE